MANYKFVYFALRGRGELIRMVFRLAKVEFQDERVNIEDWKEIKHSTPTGELPYLEVNGKRLTQSLTIARYLAREFGLAGGTNWEQALVEQVVDTCDDLRAENAKIIHERDENKLNELKLNMTDVVLPKYLDRLSSFQKQHGDKYFVGSEITLADLAVHEVMTTFLQEDPSVLDKYEALTEHRQLIEQHPNLVQYLSDRPVTIV
ncbi:probable glutathione S-transferase 9 [Saccostrea echinata]|uniref:probable glutathione S-transferase 9 n=1 Tax=Saccostrea echinata TaxID=191078 RepID=UPI002A8234AE|nr:probable glutathione S-transferase 9 [Saccostrea echinata]